MPQLNPEFFVSQLFWLAVFFSILFIFLWRVSLPRIAVALEKRQNKIDEDISSAKELQEQAQEIENNINIEINKVKAETDEQIKKTAISLQDEVSKKLNSLDKELEEKISKSEKEILKNRDNQMNEINDEVANITKITVSKLLDMKLSDSTVNEAVQSFKRSIN